MINGQDHICPQRTPPAGIDQMLRRRYKLEGAGLARGFPAQGAKDGVSMTPHMKWGIAGIIIGFILLFIVPWPIALALIVLAIAVPAGAWLMLDESQRRRYRELRRRQRGQIR
jgi:hypothetical protein